MAKKKTARRTTKRARPADPMKPIGEVAAQFAEDNNIPTDDARSANATGPENGGLRREVDKLVDTIDKPGQTAGPFPDHPHPPLEPTAAEDHETLKGMDVLGDPVENLARRNQLPGPIQVVPRPDEMLATIERLAKDPTFDVAKMQALIDMRDTSLDKQRVRDLEDDARMAERSFVVAFVPMQSDLPVVDEKGKIWNKQHTEVVATYAKWEDINEVLKPVLAQHGFMLDFETLNLTGGQLQTLGFLRHVGGHVRQSQFTGAPDESGFKNATQGIGSIRSYGKRYCAQDLLNITSRGEDDDGTKAHVPEPPPLYEAWEQVMDGLASEGIQVLQQRFNETHKTNPTFTDYATKHRSEQFGALKAMAKKATEQLLAAAREREPGEEG